MIASANGRSSSWEGIMSWLKMLFGAGENIATAEERERQQLEHLGVALAGPCTRNSNDGSDNDIVERSHEAASSGLLQIILKLAGSFTSDEDRSDIDSIFLHYNKTADAFCGCVQK
jgi:hypothetical protein